MVSAQTGLDINMNNTKIMKANSKSKNVVTAGGKPLEETDYFTYVGSKIHKTGGTEEYTKVESKKARVAFLMLSKIWKSKTDQAVLLYCSETWIITKYTVNKIQTFANMPLENH